MVILITNTIVPYCYDIAHVLGLPSYLSHRFRYHSRWIKLDHSIEEIKEQEGLIVLRNFATGDFIPVRYVMINDVLPVGDINYIEFELRDYFPVAKRERVWREISAVIKGKGLQNDEGQELECLVLEVDSNAIEDTREATDEKEQDKWKRILREIGTLDCYRDFSFLKIVHVRDAKGACSVARRDVTGKCSLVLEPDRLYFLDVIQHIPWNIEQTESIEAPYDVELKAEAGEVIVLRKIQRVVGKYDLLRFIFKTMPTYTEKYTFLEIDNRQGGQLAKYGLPALFMPIRVKPPDWMRLIVKVRVFLGAVAVVVLMASEPIARILAFGSDWVRSLALLVLVAASGKWDEFVLAFVKDTKEERLK